jgi:hypothetical protein
MAEMRNAYSVLVGKPEGKRRLGRPRRRWEGNIRLDLGKSVGRRGLDMSGSGGSQWQAVVKTVMNLRVALKAGYFLPS